ncbi:MAG TPA: prolipoprotein diacylglyceryl transferase family protein [Flavisolibacter sp.]
MYPNLYYFFKEVFGVNIGILRFINSFGFFVAIAFLVAAALLARELKRKSQLGIFQPTEMKLTVGKPATTSELLLNFLLGFVLGYKILGLFFMGPEATDDPQGYIFSGRGSFPAGIVLGGLFAWMKWREKKKQQLAAPEDRVVRMWPHDRVGELTIIALVVGLVGAKLFDIFENWSDFLKRPADYIFSGGGLTFYGGLICAAFAIVWYARKHKMPVRHLADAIAPSLMIAYAIGRIGCQVAGDGDWGIYNSAYKVDSTNSVVLAGPNDFKNAVLANTAHFSREYKNIADIQHAHFEKPGALGFLPNWMFAYQFPHNVNEVGVQISGCNEKYCKQLPVPVFPTSFYETIFCTLLFFLLWGLRKRLRPAGSLFALYLFLNGLERFFIEKIRVNNKLPTFLGMQPTQAEILSVVMMLTGVVLWVVLRKKYRATNEIV